MKSFSKIVYDFKNEFIGQILSRQIPSNHDYNTNYRQAISDLIDIMIDKNLINNIEVRNYMIRSEFGRQKKNKTKKTIHIIDDLMFDYRVGQRTVKSIIYKK